MAKKTDTLAVSFELGPQDIAYFRERLETARGKLSGSPQIIDVAEGLFNSVAATTAPAFVRASFAKLKLLIDMLRDEDWRLEGDDRARVMDALVYFAEAEDMIPDRLPGIGFLDDAIMIELVAGELEPEIDAYNEFLSFRVKRSGADAKQIESQRDELQRRMRRRDRRARSGGGGGGGDMSLFKAW
jgi:uncharacterized membrane protein YkvA (DUF1232 family)